MQTETWTAFTDELGKIAGIKSWALRQTLHGVRGGRALKKGQSSLREEAKAFLRRPARTVGRGLKSMARSPIEGPLTGIWAGMSLAEARRQKREERGENLGSLAGGLLGYSVFRKSPLLPQIAAAVATSEAGRRIGKRLARRRKRSK